MSMYHTLLLSHIYYIRMESSNVDDLIDLGAWPENGLKQLQEVVANARPWVKRMLKKLKRTGTIDRKDYLRLSR